MSTGYPNNETGHPTRSYQLIHQNPLTLIGYQAYDFCDPSAFLNTQAFITGELAEALRRSDDQASGIMHFALLTWFRQSYDYKKITPWPTYYALKRALQPVLVSAELWGRHLYNGQKLPTRIYVVDDREDGTALQPTVLDWKIVDDKGNVLKAGQENVPAVEHYGRQYIEPNIILPEQLPAAKTPVKLMLTLSENGKVVSENQYDLLLATKQWTAEHALAGKKINLLTQDGFDGKLDFVGVKYNKVSSVKDLLRGKADLCIISGVNALTADEMAAIRNYQKKGGKLLIQNSAELAKALYPEHIRGIIHPTEGDICFMEREDAKVFDGIGVLELRYFNDNQREIPLACNATLQVNRSANLTELAGQMKIHAYIDGGKPEDRIKRIDTMRGLTMMKIKDGKGAAMVSTMCVGKANTDPIAGRLLVNMLADMF